jgi:hypothetical protein
MFTKLYLFLNKIDYKVFIILLLFFLISAIPFVIYSIFNLNRRRIVIRRRRNNNNNNNNYAALYQLPNVDIDRSIPPIIEMAGIFQTEENTIRYLIDKNVLKPPLQCPQCNNLNMLRRKTYLYRCSRTKTCKYSVSLKKNTMFGNTKLKINEAFQFCYFWVAECKYTTIKNVTTHSSKTITDWSNFLREIVAWDMSREDNQGANYKIGGENIIVQLDESFFGKNKYNLGHRVQGCLVFGGVEITEERNIFAVRVFNRTAATLAPIIERYVRPRSILWMDCWKGYRNQDLINMGILQFGRVNHSENFKDPITGVHTNVIEGNWNGFKIKIPRQHYNEQFITGELFNCMWRRKYNNRLFLRLMYLLRIVRFHTNENGEVTIVANVEVNNNNNNNNNNN